MSETNSNVSQSGFNFVGDIRTMIWKELREFGRMSGTKGGGSSMLVRVLLFVVLFGIFIPLRAGAKWVDSPTSLIPMALIPLFLMMAMITDSFAGERERHTLETLLATRLSDEAILAGKIASAITYAWARAILYLVVGLVTVNIVHGHGKLLMFAGADIAAFLVFTLLLSALVGCAGVLVSLRASTVQQAARNLSFGIMGVGFGLTFLAGSSVVPEEWRASIMSSLLGNSLQRTEVLVGLVVLALDVILYLAARTRFQRARLILD